MEVLQDVEEAVEEERVVLDELVVLRHLAGHQHPQLRVDRRQPLQLRPKGRHAAAPLIQQPTSPNAETRNCHWWWRIQARPRRRRRLRWWGKWILAGTYRRKDGRMDSSRVNVGERIIGLSN